MHHLFSHPGRLYRTLRHLRRSQVQARLRRLFLAKLERVLPAPEPLPIPASPRLIPWRPPSLHDKKTVAAPGIFRFLNHEIDTARAPERGPCTDYRLSWFPPGADPLWTFNLHYFDYAFELDPPAFEAAVRDWVSQIPYGRRPAWHPYPTSLRLCNWVWRYSLSPDAFSSSFADLLKSSLGLQLHYLSGHPEFELLGNHLIANCKALIVAGIFLEQENHLRKGLTILKNELKEQILPDGGHYERSPMYHSIVLEDLLAIRKALELAQIAQPEWLTAAIIRMAAFLQAVSIANTIPLLNDSSSEIASPPKTLLAEAAKQGIETPPSQNGSLYLKDTGLFIFKSPRLSLTFDVGPIGPDFLPGHAHNDTLSICLWLNGVPILADSGIYEYNLGAWRDYFRSSKAHNVITVDDEEPNEIWKSFRVGRRGYPIDVTLESDTAIWAGHNSYADRGVLVYRKLELSPDKRTVFVTDRIDAKRLSTFESNLHFAPGIQLTRQPDQDGLAHYAAASGKEPLADLLIQIPDGAAILQGTSWYSPEFGIKQERPKLTISGQAQKGQTPVSLRATARNP